MSSVEITPELLNLFPTFDGESSTLEEYLENFNRILSAFSLNKAKGFKILPLKISHRAERAYRTAKRQGKIWDYQSLVTELGKQLATEGSRIKAKYGLAVEMKESEEICNYAERIRTNILKAYPAFAETHQECLMADAFIRGATPHIRNKMMSRTYNTLADAQEKAEMIMIKLQMSRKKDDVGEIKKGMDKLTDTLLKSMILKEEKINYTESTERRHSGTFDRNVREQQEKNSFKRDSQRSLQRERRYSNDRNSEGNQSENDERVDNRTRFYRQNSFRSSSVSRYENDYDRGSFNGLENLQGQFQNDDHDNFQEQDQNYDEGVQGQDYNDEFYDHENHEVYEPNDEYSNDQNMERYHEDWNPRFENTQRFERHISFQHDHENEYQNFGHENEHEQYSNEYDNQIYQINWPIYWEEDVENDNN